MIKVTDELRAKIQPIGNEVRSVVKARADRITAQSRRRGAEVDGNEETAQRTSEVKSVESLIEKSGLTERGINPSGLYDLCGG